MSRVKVDLTGKRFDKLVVIKQIEDYISPKGERKSRWLCQCDCGNQVVRTTNHLNRGHNQSCGCLQREIISNIGKQNKKYNIYDLSGEHGIGYTSNTNKEFYFDLEDYDLIKDYCWRENAYGYIETEDSYGKHIKMHRMVMGFPNDSFDIDHKHGQTTRNDNRKEENLRIATRSQNQMNKTLQSNNTYGVAGVYWNKNLNKWTASISVNKKQIHLGVFITFNDAVKARKEAEEKYFGEWSYDNSQMN